MLTWLCSKCPDRVLPIRATAGGFLSSNRSEAAVQLCRNCVYVPSARCQALSQYNIVVSDADDLNAVLNITTVQLFYLDFTNASIASDLVS